MQRQVDKQQIPFARPDITEAEIDAVVTALRSGWWTTGPKTREFEKLFADRFGAEALAVNSATSGLHLALEACGIGPGDEVITTTWTFTATAEVVRYLGGYPVFVDVNEDSLNMNVDLIEAAITPKTKAIMPVHMAGLACDMDEILAIAKKHNLHVIEDAAHSFPCTYKGREVGSLDSSASIYSFYSTKPIATGEGGMVVTKNPEIAARSRVMRLHGINRDAFDRYHDPKASWKYDVVAPGFKYNMTDIAAAMGVEQLKKVRQFAAQRAQVAAWYDAALADLPIIRPPHAQPGDVHSWHLYVIRLADEVVVPRDQVIERLFATGIGCSVHYIPLHLQPYWRDRYGLTPAMFPVSQHIYEHTLSLPMYSRMTESDVARVASALGQALA